MVVCDSQQRKDRLADGHLLVPWPLRRETHASETQCSQSPFSHPKVQLTLLQVKHLHSVDKVGPGIEIVGARLLQSSQAEEATISYGTAGKGTPAGHAGVARPAPHFQIKGFKGCDGQLALPSSCGKRR